VSHSHGSDTELLRGFVIWTLFGPLGWLRACDFTIFHQHFLLAWHFQPFFSYFPKAAFQLMSTELIAKLWSNVQSFLFVVWLVFWNQLVTGRRHIVRPKCWADLVGALQ
jgi:hypothetical protein